MRSLAVLSMHTSPLAQPGAGDGGGMNVYVRELCTALARSGTQCDVFTRASDPADAAVVPVEPGFRVHHVTAGPVGPVPKAALGGLVEPFCDAVAARLDAGPWGRGAGPPEAIHAHYWLSGAAGHVLKHRLGLPLISTFHTLEKVKAASGASDGADDPERAATEAAVIGCSDAVLASNPMEAEQLRTLYGARPDRVRVVTPGVDHAFFAPGQRAQARRALGLPTDGSMLLFLGRIQPLKGAELAVETLERVAAARPDAFLVVAGGPSGPEGQDELDRVRDRVHAGGLDGRVRWFPPQPHELVSTFCRAADVCLVPSRTESFGLVALEAAACATPVVASAVGGLRTLVVDGATGFLVERRPEALSAAELALLADPVRAAGMGGQAAAHAARYTWRAAAARLRALHAELSEGALVEC